MPSFLPLLETKLTINKFVLVLRQHKTVKSCSRMLLHEHSCGWTGPRSRYWNNVRFLFILGQHRKYYLEGYERKRNLNQSSNKSRHTSVSLGRTYSVCSMTTSKNCSERVFKIIYLQEMYCIMDMSVTIWWNIFCWIYVHIAKNLKNQRQIWLIIFGHW